MELATYIYWLQGYTQAQKTPEKNPEVKKTEGKNPRNLEGAEATMENSVIKY